MFRKKYRLFWENGLDLHLRLLFAAEELLKKSWHNIYNEIYFFLEQKAKLKFLRENKLIKIKREGLKR